jgi:uncharacterized protein YpiB (UPF0302 family)
MQIPVSVQDKKTFIQWFLNHYQLKKRESVWILNYLVNHHDLLVNLHFVRDAKFCPRGIVMTSHCSNEAPFRFYKKQLVTTDAEKSFHDIRLNQDEPLYLQLNFNKSYQNASYVAVLEQNPYTPEEFFITKDDKAMATNLLNQTLYNYKKNKLMREINCSLDEMDQKKFMDLTRQLQILEEGQPPLLMQ